MLIPCLRYVVSYKFGRVANLEFTSILIHKVSRTISSEPFGMIRIKQAVDKQTVDYSLRKTAHDNYILLDLEAMS